MHLFCLGLKRHLEKVSVTFSAEQFESTASKQTSPENHTEKLTILCSHARTFQSLLDFEQHTPLRDSMSN